MNINYFINYPIVTKMNSICYLYHLYITITDYLRAAYIQCRSICGQSTSSFNITCVVLQYNISQPLFSSCAHNHNHRN